MRCATATPQRRTPSRAPKPFEGNPGPAAIVPPLTILQAQKQAKELSTLAAAERNEAQKQANQLRTLAVEQHNEELHRLLVILGIALAVMAIISMGLGWLVAGRALRPLQTITKAARAISATNLHKRLSLRGPDDELRELGATFDELLERLERSFEAQRQFVANASHELRTPLTLERATIEVALADPAATTADLRTACERVLAIGEQQERTIDALLALARGERGLDRRTLFDLKAPLAEVVDSRREEIERRELSLESNLANAVTAGDRRLVERLAANLLDNAIHHNEERGWIKLSTTLESDDAVLRIANSGQVVPPEELEQLFEPFRRLGPARSARGEGHGLGLSIVTAVAAAHGAKTNVRARPQGGLEVEVRFPAAARADTESTGDEAGVNGSRKRARPAGAPVSGATPGV